MEVVSLLNNPSPAESQPETSRGHALGTAVRVPFRGHGSNFEFPGEIPSTSTGDDSIKGITYTDHHGPHNSSTGGADHPNSIPDAYHRTHNSGPNNSGPSSMARGNSFFAPLPDSHPNSGPYNHGPPGLTGDNSSVSAPRSGYHIKFGSFSFNPHESRPSSSTRSNSISIPSPRYHTNSSPSGSTGDNSSVSPPRSDYHMNSGSHDFGPHDSRPQSSSSRNLSIRSFHTATDSQATISSNYSGVHSRYTSVSSCHSQPEPEPETIYQMTQQNYHGSGGPAGLIVPSYVPGTRNRVTLSDDNAYIYRPSLNFEQKLRTRHLQLEDMREAARNDILEFKFRCAGSALTINDKDTITCSDEVLMISKRKIVSHLFGRNKAATKLIDDHVWVMMCRKHYQRTKYRSDETFPHIQAELCELDLFKIKIWSGLNEANLGNDGNPQGPVIAHWDVKARLRSADRKTAVHPIDAWLQAMVDSKQHYTTDEILALMFRIRVELLTGTRQSMPDIEVLPTYRGDGTPTASKKRATSTRPTTKKAAAKKAAASHSRAKSLNESATAKRNAAAVRRNRSLNVLPRLRGEDMDDDNNDDEGDARGTKRRRLEQMDPSRHVPGQADHLVLSNAVPAMPAQTQDFLRAPFLPSFSINRALGPLPGSAQDSYEAHHRTDSFHPSLHTPEYPPPQFSAGPVTTGASPQRIYATAAGDTYESTQDRRFSTNGTSSQPGYSSGSSSYPPQHPAHSNSNSPPGHAQEYQSPLSGAGPPPRGPLPSMNYRLAARDGTHQPFHGRSQSSYATPSYGSPAPHGGHQPLHGRSLSSYATPSNGGPAPHGGHRPSHGRSQSSYVLPSLPYPALPAPAPAPTQNHFYGYRGPYFQQTPPPQYTNPAPSSYNTAPDAAQEPWRAPASHYPPLP
ncbi:hypothetical protein B0T18DRAFT_386482 [Schizothecium vesticola]|uniref:Uncharacterized protein n=1 Tax=Schizothecium vesticola TaxID=314040 RepID=A0AA40FBB4_9PEZI|nr:hypothetical protein B0T18DRAFT_386482 [Schizothecium vesticola]